MDSGAAGATVFLSKTWSYKNVTKCDKIYFLIKLVSDKISQHRTASGVTQPGI